MRVVEAHGPDVVLLDVHMPDGGGVAVIERVAPAQPAVRFLALSVSDAPEDVIAVIRAGARGYVTKTISGADLAAAVRRVHEGDAVFSPRLAGFVLDAFAGGPPPAGDAELEGLTPREREVLQHIARGYMYKEFGKTCGVTETRKAKRAVAHAKCEMREQAANPHHKRDCAEKRAERFRRHGRDHAANRCESVSLPVVRNLPEARPRAGPVGTCHARARFCVSRILSRTCAAPSRR